MRLLNKIRIGIHLYACPASMDNLTNGQTLFQSQTAVVFE